MGTHISTSKRHSISRDQYSEIHNWAFWVGGTSNPEDAYVTNMVREVVSRRRSMLLIETQKEADVIVGIVRDLASIFMDERFAISAAMFRLADRIAGDWDLR